MGRIMVFLLSLQIFLSAASGAPELNVEEIKNRKADEKPAVMAQKTEEPVSEKVSEKPAVKSPDVKPDPGMKQVGEIDFRLGELKVRNKAKNGDLDEEDIVFEKDTLITGVESRCEIKLSDGSLIRLNEKTKYIIDKFDQSGNDVAFNGFLVSGESWTNVNKADSKKKDFNVRSPIAVAAVIGTNYKMSSDGKLTEISVMDGQVNVDLEKQKKAELKIEPKTERTGSLAPKQSMAPKQIPGPYEVTLSEWISIVKGEMISIRNDGKYSKRKTDVNVLMNEWEAFRSGK
ncbi:MAG: FecR domain-containing protein [Candidatus Delongbacteria bacterium]|nr:FecR domain-containing protein [Candidatus Delongbacteria bacterium]